MTPSFSYNGTNGLELRYCCFFEFFSGSTSQTLDSVIIFRRICQTAIPGTKLVSTIAGLLYNNQVMMWNDIDACVLCLWWWLILQLSSHLVNRHRLKYGSRSSLRRQSILNVSMLGVFSCKSFRHYWHNSLTLWDFMLSAC